MARIDPHPNPARPPFRLKTFGTTTLLHPDGREAIAPSKPLALLTYLHFTPGRTATRDHLCALLWGDSTPRHAYGSLRTTLHRIRVQLGEHAADGGTTTVALRLPIAADRDAFLDALAGGDFASATDLYRGPFFPEFGDPGTSGFEQWADGERARLSELFVRASESLIRRELDAGHSREAVRLARRLRSLVPESETGWRLLLEGLILAKDDLAARAEAESFGSWLEKEGVEPAATTRRLISRIREGGAAPAERAEDGGLVAELIGRERPFATVLQAWDAVRRGRSYHVHVTAPAGIGKTRLLTDLAGRLTSAGARLVSVRANVGERGLDYALAADLARRLGGLPGAVGVPPRTAGILVGLQPALASVFPAAQIVTADDLLLQRAQAIGELLAAVVEDSPVAILVDDSHWLDSASRHILRSVAGRLDHNPVLLVTAGRPPEAALPTGGATTTIVLEPLSAAGVEAFLGSLGELPEAAWPERLVAALHGATRGSPLLLLETLQLARDRNELTLEDGVWTCPDPEAVLAKLAVTDPLTERLRALDGESRRLVQYLAVSGAPLATEELAALANRPAPAVETALVALERRALVLTIGGRWGLAHDEIGAGLLGLMTAEELQSVHRSLGRHWAVGTGETIPRAIQHLAAADADGEIAPLFRRWVAAARQRGETVTIARLAHEVLGEYATPDRIKVLEQMVPSDVRRRLRFRRPVAGGAVIATALGFLSWSLMVANRAPVEEELLVATGGTPDAMALFRVPVRTDAWSRTDSIRPEEGKPVGKWSEAGGDIESAAMSPDGQRIAYSRIVRDSGVIDLFLREADGRIRRLTETAGDDMDPSWSPDGRFLAFRTARWTPRDDDDADIGILEVGTGAVRQLTAGPATDRSPKWSPDGSRIAFTRRGADSNVVVCWVTVDGGTTVCLPSQPGTQWALGGWLDAARLGVVTGAADAATRLSALSLSSGGLEIIDTTRIGTAVVSPDGRWAATGLATGGLAVFPIAEPRRRRFLGRPLEGMPPPFWAPLHVTGRYRRHLAGSPSAMVGVSHRLRVDGSDPVPREVLRWRSGDQRLATVDSVTGVLSPMGAGTVWVHVSAGGWWRDSLRLEIREARSRQVLLEDWTDPGLVAWRTFGDPKPRIAPGPGGGSAFHNNGDRSFESGVVSAKEFAVDAGLGFEAPVSISVTRPKWQQLRVGLLANAVLGDNGFTATGCFFSLPAGEGVTLMTQMEMSAAGDGFMVAADPALRSGGWHRLRVQIFPDGTCGVAMDGVAVWRSVNAVDLAVPYALGLYGHSVGTSVLVGPVEVWQGVKAGVNWSGLETNAGVAKR